MNRFIDKSNIEVSITSNLSPPQSTLLQNSIMPSESVKTAQNALARTVQIDKNHTNLNEKKTRIVEVGEKKNSNTSVLVSLIAGAVAGGLAKTTIAPLDRAKINFQIRKDMPYSFKAAVQFLKNIYVKEGIFGLWRGNSATMARIIPYAAVQFASHEQFKKILKVDQHGTNTKGKRFIAGSLAGVTSQTLTYPLDLARARMAVTGKNKGYDTLTQVFTQIWKGEGPKTFFRGYWPTVLGVIPYAGTSFFTYETLKKEYREFIGVSNPGPMVNLIFGSVAGLAGQTTSYPLDIVRRRMQTMGIKYYNPNYSTILSSMKTIYRDEGIRKGFFKGLSMNWIKGPIAVGISFSTYDFIKEFLSELEIFKRVRKDS